MRVVIKFLASLKLAVVIIAVISIVVAVGTFVEAKYDALTAKKLVYDTWWMWGSLLALSVSLIAVMVDRWPWKLRHLPFLFAHVGILILLLGAYITSRFGVDGSMGVKIGESNRWIVLPQTDVMIYASFDGNSYTKLFEQEVDFLLDPPSQKPVGLDVKEGRIEFVDFKPWVFSSNVVTPAPNAGVFGAGVRFQLQNPNANVVEWLVQRRPSELASKMLGPAALNLGAAPPMSRGMNEIFFVPEADRLKLVVFGREREKPLLEKKLEEGQEIELPWMGLKLRILRWLPRAQQSWDIKEAEYPTPMTTAAVKIRFRDTEQWILLNDTLRFFTEDTAYFVSYLNRRVDLGFPLQLKNFEKIDYAGTRRAMEYKSHVIIPDAGEYVISMNEPLKYKGFTVYQASFEQDESGRPITSVFSINRDPGRWLKYLGSLILSIGIVLLFWFRRIGLRKASV